MKPQSDILVCPKSVPKNICTFCNNGLNEDLMHILRYCPVYKVIREHFKFNYIANSEQINKEIIQELCKTTE